jgi:glutamate racemase
MLMKTKNIKDYIGVFDSGAGGTTVLKECVKLLPNENFYYYGDSKHAPYGEKSTKEIQDRTMEAINQMLNHGAKAIVIACNTATSAAVKLARDVYPEVPIIGVEPALKPATKDHKKILVLATEKTLALDKFHELAKEYAHDVNVYPVAGKGLAKAIEEGHLDDDVIQKLLHDCLDQYVNEVDAVVLGCTHYPIIKDQILKILNVDCYDGGEGTARQLKRKLEEHNLLSASEEKGDVLFESSLDEAIDLYKKVYDSYHISL